MSVTVAELPRWTPNYNGLTITSASVVVTSSGSIQDGIETALGLGRNKVILEAGGRWTEQIELPSRGRRPAWFGIFGENGGPAEGTRITPTLAADTYDYPRITAPVGFKGLTFAAGCQRVFLSGFEVAVESAIGYPGVAIVDLHPDGDNSRLAAITDYPCELVLRHLWIHGPRGTLGRRFGIRAHAKQVAILDCWVDHLNYNGTDYSQQAQSVTGNDFPGQLYVENNFLWRASEAFAFGGSGSFPVMRGEQMLPCDITFRRNHIYTPLALKGFEGCANTGETKKTRRLLYEANIAENTHTDMQNGYAGPCGFSINQSAADGPHTQVCDVTARYNWYKNHNSGHSLQGGNGYLDWPSIDTRRVNIHDNFFTGAGTPQTAAVGGGAGFNRMWTIQGVTDVRYANNLSIIAGGHFMVIDPVQQNRWAIENNLLGSLYTGGYIVDSSSGNGQVTWDILNAGGTLTFRGNGILNPDGTGLVNPGTNAYKTLLADMGFVDGSKIADTGLKFVGLSALALAGGSSLRGTAYGGGDPGPNWTTVLAALTGVEAAQADLDVMDP